MALVRLCDLYFEEKDGSSPTEFMQLVVEALTEEFQRKLCAAPGHYDASCLHLTRTIAYASWIAEVLLAAPAVEPEVRSPSHSKCCEATEAK
jgi:hypothetical protein